MNKHLTAKPAWTRLLWTRLSWTLAAAALMGLSVTADAAQTPGDPTSRNPASKEEGIGFGAGGVVGAAAGGPLGFVIGAAIGGTLGDAWERKNSTIAGLQAETTAAEISVHALRRDVDQLSAELVAAHAELDQLERVAHPELLSLMQAGLELDLLFRTDEHSLLPETENRLAGLGARLAAMSDLQIHLDGYADERGDRTYNLRLSAERVAYVREQLLAAGVEPGRISEIAHGEVESSEPGEDSYALERRVSLKVFIDPEVYSAQE